MFVAISKAVDIRPRLGSYTHHPNFSITIRCLRYPLGFIKCLIQFFSLTDAFDKQALFRFDDPGYIVFGQVFNGFVPFFITQPRLFFKLAEFDR